MIMAASLQTLEIDDVPAACRELKAQLDGKLTLLKNSVGIIQCPIEAVEAGIVEALYRELGIPLVGGITVATATDCEADNLLFSMLVLTSDDVGFTVSHTAGLYDDPMKSVAASMDAAIGGRLSQLKLVLAFMPVSEGFSGDHYVDIIEAACGKVPIFGTNLIDYNFPDFSHCVAICNDKVLSGEMAYILLTGDVSARFYIAAIPSLSNIETTAAVITRASDNIIHEINAMPANEYIHSLWPTNGKPLTSGADLLLPLLVTTGGPENTRPFVRGLIRIDPQGFIVCSGRMPEGACIAFGSDSSADIISSTTGTVAEALSEDGTSAALIFSCVTRQIVIGYDQMKELKQIQSMFPADIPFMASYSGGEFAPTSVSAGNTAQNRYHNYSLVICLLK